MICCPSSHSIVLTGSRESRMCSEADLGRGHRREESWGLLGLISWVRRIMGFFSASQLLLQPLSSKLSLLSMAQWASVLLLKAGVAHKQGKRSFLEALSPTLTPSKARDSSPLWEIYNG